MDSEEFDRRSMHHYSASQAALVVLLILQTTMLLAMFSRTEPHPPVSIPLFGMAPFLGASIALAISACMLGAHHTKTGRMLCLLVLLFALVTFGPQKWLDPTFDKIWPAVVLAQLAMIVVGVSCYRYCRLKGLDR